VCAELATKSTLTNAGDAPERITDQHVLDVM